MCYDLSFLSLTDVEDWPEDCAVVDRGAVPALEPELELALGDAPARAAAHVHHVVRVQHAQLLLADAETRDLLAKGHRATEQEGLIREGFGALKAETPEMKCNR